MRKVTAARLLTGAESAVDRLLIVPAAEEDIIRAYIGECAARVRYETAETVRQYWLGLHRIRGFPKTVSNIKRSTRTHCPQGHEFTPENTITDRSTGYRRCRVCRQAQEQKHYVTRRAASGHVV